MFLAEWAIRKYVWHLAGKNLHLALELADHRATKVYKIEPEEIAKSFSQTSCRDFLAWYMILAGDKLPPREQAKLLASSYRSTVAFQDQVMEYVQKRSCDYKIAIQERRHSLRMAGVMDLLSKMADYKFSIVDKLTGRVGKF